jgi:glucose/arabinose dehydrogenase
MSGRIIQERWRRHGPFTSAAVVLTAILGACADDSATSPSTADERRATTTSAPPPTNPTTSSMPSTSVHPPDTAAPTSVPASATTLPADPPPANQLAGVQLTQEPFVDLPLLVAMATRPIDGQPYFASQSGEIWRVVAGKEPELVLDLSPVVSPYENGSERGLLGIEFNPADGRLFVYYTDANIDSHLVSYAIGRDGRPDPASAREVLFVEQPGLGHKGGGIAFEPDGTLYLALGDGGGSNGRDAQDHTKLHGAILRIRPRPHRPGYIIPPDNPYVGDPSVRPEIWAKGLRNPWGFWRDPATGDLWTADVGDHAMEEIDRLAAGDAGRNLGWYYIEGTHVNHHGAPADVLPPVYAYSHDDVGPAAIGGRVYRGHRIPQLRGAYLFADMSGPILAIGAGGEAVRLDLHRTGIVTGFGTLADGELIVLTLSEGAHRLTPGQERQDL